MKHSIFFIFLMLAFAGCGDNSPTVNKGDSSNLLPANTKILEDMGNGWVKVEIKGQKYLYRARDLGTEWGSEVLARIND